ncbi:hypothetical protein ACIXR1_000883 [Staphylococcus aureus]|uniref:hypothetical protein n=1 Tax=Staphylococcus aureus TaxID=1280 RepID=UPI0004459300|nr:hypothetical protein [Staphylococcus aureus]EYP21983.1 hypothetical protein W215_02590 [Staphylococcus aureus DAR1158]EYP29325.1 hypothetical protein W215_00620 [Staphylococcus aureus DAR1158]MBO8738419.1 hypothetical protein [Staphylococcus aureus]MBO8898725.1 hypothetical protein [Staphylococcus aureus]MBS5107218.1 hypothetical protein [Staphylococcus aureus]
MKIKVKKEMRLDELIKWARENPELSKGKNFFTTGNGDGIVRFQKDTNECTTSVCVPLDAPFEVEVEEEITEDTKFDRLFEVYEFRERAYMSALHTNTSIKERLENTSFPTKAFYILNDDMTLTLIWKEGHLID